MILDSRGVFLPSTRIDGGPSKGTYQEPQDSLEDSSASSKEAKGAQNSVEIMLK